MAVHVVLVEPQFAGNLGSVARAMANFGLESLILVDPATPITEESRNMAVHAQYVLDAARVVPTFAEVVDEMDYLVAFAARVSDTDRTHLRVPVPLRDLAPKLHEMEGEIALVFGREDFGLSNDDVLRCDVVCTIPTSEKYRSLNLSHASAVAFYELFASRFAVKPQRAASARDKKLLLAALDRLLETTRMQPHRREITNTMFRRVIGRAGLSTWEFHRMMGIFNSALRELGARPPPGGWRDILDEADDPEAGEPDPGTPTEEPRDEAAGPRGG